MYRKIENLKEVLENHLAYLETGDLSKHADLTGANLSGAQIDYTLLDGTNLLHANLSGVDLNHVYLIDTDLNCAEGLNGKK